MTVAGAASTRSLASLRPRLVTSRTALMTLIFLSPAALRTTSNSVFSSTGGGRGAATAPPGGHGRGRRGDAVVVLERLDEVVQLEDGQLVDLLDEIFGRDSHVLSLSSYFRVRNISDRQACRARRRCLGLLRSSFFCRTWSSTIDERLRHGGQHPDEPGDRRLHQEQQLGDQLLAAGQRGDRP